MPGKWGSMNDVWLSSDLRNVLSALLATNDAAMMLMPADDAGAAYYRPGFAAALAAVAVATNIPLDRRVAVRNRREDL